MEMPALELVSVIVLLDDVAGHGLLRGQVGTAVERLVPSVYEAEFIDDDGGTYSPGSAIDAVHAIRVCLTFRCQL